MRLAISRDVLSLDALVREVERDAQTRGEGTAGCARLSGRARDPLARRVRYLEYEAFAAGAGRRSARSSRRSAATGRTR
jgi:hypothetical protein